MTRPVTRSLWRYVRGLLGASNKAFELAVSLGQQLRHKVHSVRSIRLLADFKSMKQLRRSPLILPLAYDPLQQRKSLDQWPILAAQDAQLHAVGCAKVYITNSRVVGSCELRELGTHFAQ